MNAGLYVLFGTFGLQKSMILGLLQNRPRGVEQYTITKRTPTFFSGDSSPILGSLCLLPEERRLSMPESGEKERNYLFKSYTDLK